MRSRRVPVAPSGWPSAMAPPFTFTRSRSSPSSFSTARYWAAKASLISNRSIWSSVSPARSSAADRRCRADAHDRRDRRRPRAQATIRASGFRPAAGAPRADATTAPQRRPRCPLALPAVTMPSLPNAGGSFARPSRWCRARGGRPCRRLVALARLDRDRHDLLGEPPGRPWRRARAVAAERVLVLLLARDAVLGARFSAVCAMKQPAVGILERDHRANPRAACAEANAARARRGSRAAPGSCSPCRRPARRGLAEHDQLGAADDRLDARAAQAVDRQRRHLDRARRP